MPSFEQDQLPVEPYTVFIDKPINASSLENGEESQQKPRYFRKLSAYSTYVEKGVQWPGETKSREFDTCLK